MPRMLIVSGGWEGHQPQEIAEVFRQVFVPRGWDVEQSSDLDDFRHSDQFDVIVPNWTMGEIETETLQALMKAVEGGVGLAGTHGGMGDAFRQSTEYQFMVGGQFVAHPGAGDRRYLVELERGWSLTDGLDDFEVETEKYYMHVDPSIKVLATTRFEEFGDLVMPVAWTRKWGDGKVFYCSLGHTPEILRIPAVLELVIRGVELVSDRSASLQGSYFR